VAVATRSDLLYIPGIGRTFVKDFTRIGVTRQADLAGCDADALFARLTLANASEQHATSRTYLYVIRMAVYYANGGRDPARLKWHAWKDG
jgi:hypothetical protein